MGRSARSDFGKGLGRESNGSLGCAEDRETRDRIRGVRGRIAGVFAVAAVARGGFTVLSGRFKTYVRCGRRERDGQEQREEEDKPPSGAGV